MNMHLSPQDPDVRAQLERDAAEAAAEARARRRRLTLWLVLALLATAAFVAFLLWRANAPKPTAPPPEPPAVTVMVPGTRDVAERVAAVGTIEARRDMPVGVVGEGGMVTAIRAEAGQPVARGQVLAEIDSAVQRAQLAQLQAGVAQADADARLAQAELDRALALVERGFISKADIERRTATRDAARARAAVARAQVREMQERIARLAIRAPEAGVVLERRVEPGQVVSPASGALFRVAAGGQMELRAEVAEQDMPQLRVGQTAEVTPIGSTTAHVGTIWLLEPVIDRQSRQGIARIALPPSPELRAGGFANAVIEGTVSQRPVLPQSAVQTDSAGAYVLVVGPDGIVKRQPVKIGTVSAAGVAIAEGLSGREQVVVSAGAFLNPGEKVRPVVRQPASAPAAPARAN
ncbi:MAG: efflux RND transporter periplasmic adaptor subunit [Sphingomonadaceae bacterium]